MISNDDIQMFEDYYGDLLSSENRLKMEQRFSSDVEFKNQYENFVLARKALEEIDRIEILEKVNELYQKENTSAASKGINRQWLGAVAAMLIIGLLFWLILGQTKQGDDHKQLFAQYFELYPDRVSVMGDSVEQGSIISCLEFYNEGKINEAILCLENMDSSNTGSLYLAVSYLKEGNAEKALPLLTKLEAVQYNPEVIDWYLALAHLSLDQKDKSIQYLQKINKREGVVFMQSKAKELMDKLDGL